jgi:acyl-CoA synthetase (NDP forming)
VDHVIYCIGLENMPAFLDSAAKKGVKSIHVFSARGAETGRADAKALELEVKNKAKHLGIRRSAPTAWESTAPSRASASVPIFPRRKAMWEPSFRVEAALTDICRYGTLRGLRFSKLVSYGNAIDIMRWTC